MLASKGLAVEHATQFTIDGAGHRATFAHVPLISRRGVLAVSLYLRHSEGLSPENTAILEAVAA